MINPEHDAQVVTRIVQQDFPLWMSVTFYLAAFVSTAIFFYGCYIQVRKYKRGQPFSLAHIKKGNC